MSILDSSATSIRTIRAAGRCRSGSAPWRCLRASRRRCWLLPGVEAEEARAGRGARRGAASCWSTFETKAKKAANLDAYKAQLAEIEQSFGAMLRKLPNKTEVPNLLIDISQQGLGAGLEQKLFQPDAEIRRTSTPSCRSRSAHRRLPRDRRVRERHRGAAAHRDAARHRDHARQAGRRRAAPDQLQLDVTAKTYRYLDEEEQARRPRSKGAKRRQAQGGQGTGFNTEQRTCQTVAAAAARDAAQRVLQRHGRAAAPRSTRSRPSGRPHRAAAGDQAVRERSRTSGRTCARRSCRAARRGERRQRRPDVQRPREFLEQFPLDTLRMVGTLRLQGRELRAGADARTGSCIACCRATTGQNDGRVIGHRPTRRSR